MADQEDDVQDRAAFQPSVPIYYSNVINLNLTIHDVRLSFGKVRPGTDMTYDVAVYLPHTAAKQLSGLLSTAIDQYEKQFGEIRLEPLKKNN